MKCFYVFDKQKPQQRLYRFFVLAALLLFCTVGQLKAQCYEQSRSSGMKEMKNKNYDKAIQWFNAAKGCDDLPSSNDLDAKIKECQNLKAKAAKAAKDAKEAQDRQRQEARIREEQERLQREYEEEQERQMAQRAYMQITGVRFVNVDENGNTIGSAGILYWQDIKYIAPVLEYNGIADSLRSTTLYCKIYKPNGVLITRDDSPYGYTYSYTMNVEPGYDNERELDSWGGTFMQGTYTFEIYNGFGEKLDMRTFTVFDKPPTTVALRFSVSDRSATITVKDGYTTVASGKGSLDADLEIDKTFTVETSKRSHKSQTRTVKTSKNMSNKSFDLDSPEPIYGSLSITASKKDVAIYIDDNYRGTAPKTFDQMLIGNYNVRMKKDKFHDYTQMVTINEGRTASLHAEMQRIKREPWLTKRNYNFATSFLDAMYGFSDMSLGLHYAYCGSHLGFFAHYMHSLESKKGQSISAGFVLRLTNDVIDFQLFAGPAYNRMLAYSYYDDYYDTDWMANAGIRIGWKERGGLALWDLMGGVMTDFDQYLPYVGIGVGYSVIGGLGLLIGWAATAGK